MITVDLFAGAGGSSVGAEMAGARVVLAANHWREAVEVHRRNHPGAEHWLQDLQQADFRLLPAHDLLLATPSCVGHTRARGRERPGHDAARSTAWAVVSAAEAARPSWVVVENVPEFLRWPLFPAWRLAMETMGYSLAPHIVDAADLGVPQHRRRLYVVCARGRAMPSLSFPRRGRRTARGAVRWDEGTWRPWGTENRNARGLRALCPRTLARLAAGRQKHGDRFLLAYYGSETGGRSADRPCGTLTTRDRYAVVRGDHMRWLSVAEQLTIMGFPDTYQMPADRRLSTHMLGNAVCPPVMAEIVRQVRALG